MTKTILTSAALAAILVLTGCSQAGDVAEKATDSATKVVNEAAGMGQGMGSGAMGAGGMGAGGMGQGMAGGGMGSDMSAPAETNVSADSSADLSLLSAGTYKSDDTHEYVAFDYLHQGYSRPILTWDEIDATIELNPENPEASSLTVSIPTTSINSGVPIWDERLQNSTFFDAAAHPAITFNSTSLNMTSKSKGTVTGDLTIKGMSKPLTMDVTLNKVGKHFRSGKDHFGISATASLNRSDWGLSTGIPATSDNVNLRIEVEFGKE